MDDTPSNQELSAVDFDDSGPFPSMRWEQICPTVDMPSPQRRDRHTVCCHDGNLYLVGGRDGGTSFSDFWSWTPSILCLLLLFRNAAMRHCILLV